MKRILPKMPDKDETVLELVSSTVLYNSQYLFLSTYLKWPLKESNKSTFTEVYVTLKLIFSIVCFLNGYYNCIFIKWLLIWLGAETVLYNLLYILCKDFFTTPKSYKRVLILGFFNYIEIVFIFASLYAAGNYILKASDILNVDPVFEWIDYVYYSIGTGGVLGFGDYVVLAFWGKVLSIVQCLVFLMFFILFISYNISMFSNSNNSTKDQSGVKEGEG